MEGWMSLNHARCHAPCKAHAEHNPVTLEASTKISEFPPDVGTIKNRNLTVLINFGSNHSFMDAHTVKETGYQGISEEGKLSMINSGAMRKFLKKGNALFAHLFMMNSAKDQDQESEVIVLHVLEQFIDVFSEPKSLLPIRSLDHRISLKPGSSP
ncbi:hypothetical protein KY289_007795 [Solanum tuberosum]|nr:hypothetical protein KY289_007795 [Solanum tuberosum]